MLDEDDLAQIEAREAAATGDGWTLGSAHEASVVIVNRGEARSELRLMRDFEPASDADYEFVASSRRDVRLLIRARREGTPPLAEELELIRTRVEAASPAPWQVF